MSNRAAPSRGARWWLWAGVVLAVVAPVSAPEQALGECRRECAAGEGRDPEGCCIPAPRGPAPCALGKARTNDTKGNCCWPTQTWDGKQCAGVPTCPDGFENTGSECVLSKCEEGQKRSSDNVHCCWPGQKWDGGQRACTGAPLCPAALEADASECVSKDRDNDGIPNATDKCPKEAEDKDGFQDDDGCPELDNDADGIPDDRDRCRNEPEDRNGFKDTDGCPDAADLVALSEQQRKDAEELERQRKAREDEAIKRLQDALALQVENVKRRKAEEDRMRQQALELNQRLQEEFARQASAAPPPGGAEPGKRGTIPLVFGVVGLTAGMVAGLAAMDSVDKLKEQCPTRRDCDPDLVSSAQFRSTLSTLSFVAGGGLLAVGLGLRWWGGPAKTAAASTTLRLGAGSAFLEGKF